MKAGNVDLVNRFYRRFPDRREVTPLVQCEGDECHTLVSNRKGKLVYFTPRGEHVEKRLCKDCTIEHHQRAAKSKSLSLSGRPVRAR